MDMELGCTSPLLPTQNSFLLRSHCCLALSHISVCSHQDDALGTETMNMIERVE